MNEYTIYCNPIQTRKALELGAPIEILPNYTEYMVFPLVKCKDGNERPCIIPTAEQMIEWLEEQGVFITIAPDTDENTCANYVETKEFAICNEVHPSRKKAKLAAIDAALKYLINNKK